MRARGFDVCQVHQPAKGLDLRQRRIQSVLGSDEARIGSPLRRANGEEAKAAIDHAMLTLEPDEPVTRDSPIVDLGLGQRTTLALEGQLCFTVGDVCQKSYTDLRRIAMFGDHTISQIRVALSKYGFELRRDLVDGAA